MKTGWGGSAGVRRFTAAIFRCTSSSGAEKSLTGGAASSLGLSDVRLATGDSVSFSPPSADADEVVDRTGRNCDRQMIPEKLRDLAISAAFLSQCGDHVRMKFKFDRGGFSGISSNNLLILGSMDCLRASTHCIRSDTEQNRMDVVLCCVIFVCVRYFSVPNHRETRQPGPKTRQSATNTGSGT